MKRINTIFALAAGIAAFASCDVNKTPVWSDDDAFAAFDKTAVSVKEDAGSVKIPVTIASIDPVEVAVTYAAVDTLGAKNGVNFKLKDESGVLAFDGEQRTAYIEIEIIDQPGTFTGDLKFSVDLKGAGDLNLGANKTCVVTITDNDHPLAAILGTYKASADSYFSNLGHFDWEINVVKDPEDVSVVWFENLDPYFAQNGISATNGKNRFCGNVNKDMTKIVIPQDQKMGYENVVLVGFDDPDPDKAAAESEVTVEIKDNGQTLTFVNSFGMYDEGFWNLFRGNLTITKK